MHDRLETFAALGYGALGGEPVVWLFVVGAFGGLLGTVTLDAVRTAGLRAGAFPMTVERPWPPRRWR